MAINSERLSQDEYENQFFGMSSTDLTQALKKVVKRLIQDTLTDLEDEVLKTCECTEEFVKDVEVKINKLYAVYMKSAKIAFDKFEEESKKIFAIPRNVLLKEDKLKIEQVSDEDIHNLKKEVFHLEQILIGERVYQAKIRQMKETYETVVNPNILKMDHILLTANRHFQKSNGTEENRIVDLYKSRIEQFFTNAESYYSLVSNPTKDNSDK